MGTNARKLYPVPRAESTRSAVCTKTTNERHDTNRVVGKHFRLLAYAADDRAADLLVAKVRSIDSNASADEIAYFLDVKARQASTARGITNLVGFLIWSVPQCFGGGMIEDYRDAVREEAKQRAQKLESDRAYWLAVLADPNEHQEFKDSAREFLASLEAGDNKA